MSLVLKGYQFSASKEITSALRKGTRDYTDDGELGAVILSAPTGAGKTVIASSVIETVFDGNDAFPPDPDAVFLWVTDDPSLNQQTIRNMTAASGLGSSLVTIPSSFDEEKFERGNVYFLNIQKLSRGNPLTRSNVDARQYSLWQTIANTIDDVGGHFYVVIDEAHRGTRVQSDRPTIVSRIINGQAGINPPAPIVWGISATPERFNEAIKTWGHRFNRAVPVPVSEVRSSGLLKDKIVLDNPALGQVEGDTSFLRVGVAQTLAFEAEWNAYAQSQNEPPVVPALVVQVQNNTGETEMAEILGSIFDAWDGLTDANVVNTFADHTAISAGGHTVAYLAPQDIQDDTDVRVILCKDAISTGWDCPRAEVMVSMRKSTEYTYIAQLIGRMVRTPLARTIPTKGTLNDVHCYLPRFNKDQVASIVSRFEAGENDEPPIEVVVNPVTLERNDEVPDEVFDLLRDLPTYVVPGRIYRTQMSRLHTLATLLAGDNIVEDAVKQVRIKLNGVLAAERKRMEADGSFQKALTRVRNLRVERSYLLLAAESLDDLPTDATYDLGRDDNNIDDLFKVAKRKLPEGVAMNYWNEVITEQGSDDYDPTEAKAETAVLALHPQVIETVEAASEQMVRTWLKQHQRNISKLGDAKKVLYEPVRQETRTPELTDLVLQVPKTVSDTKQPWDKHVLVREDGKFPGALKGWEPTVLGRELKDDDLVAWYRNPTGGSGAVRVPYKGIRFDLSMYPDFVMFHRMDDGTIKPSIIDPHGYHLADAAAKLRGLAEYAKNHGDVYDRIDAVAEINKKLLALDMKSETVRNAVKSLDDGGVKELFEKHAGAYN